MTEASVDAPRETELWSIYEKCWNEWQKLGYKLKHKPVQAIFLAEIEKTESQNEVKYSFYKS